MIVSLQFLWIAPICRARHVMIHLSRIGARRAKNRKRFVNETVNFKKVVVKRLCLCLCLCITPTQIGGALRNVSWSVFAKVFVVCTRIQVTMVTICRCMRGGNTGLMNFGRGSYYQKNTTAVLSMDIIAEVNDLTTEHNKLNSPPFLLQFQLMSAWPCLWLSRWHLELYISICHCRGSCNRNRRRYRGIVSTCYLIARLFA